MLKDKAAGFNVPEGRSDVVYNLQGLCDYTACTLLGYEVRETPKVTKLPIASARQIRDKTYYLHIIIIINGQELWIKTTEISGSNVWQIVIVNHVKPFVNDDASRTLGFLLIIFRSFKEIVT